MRPYGTGIGWRPQIAGLIASLKPLDFVEVVAENVPRSNGSNGRPMPWPLLTDLGVPVIAHGIGLGLGSAEPVPSARIDWLARCGEVFGAGLISEHVAFVRAGGTEVGHLLPIPRTSESLRAISTNISRTQRRLGSIRLAVENVAALFEWPDAEFDEPAFLSRIVEETGVDLLLDLANVYANCRNTGRDPFAEIEAMPLERLAYCHVAGGLEVDGRYHDTHGHPVPDEVFALVEHLHRCCDAQGIARPGIMLERDENFPPGATLTAEFARLARSAVSV